MNNKKIIPFPRSSSNQNELVLTHEENEKLNTLITKLNNSISPSEASYYRNQINTLITYYKSRKLNK